MLPELVYRRFYDQFEIPTAMGPRGRPRFELRKILAIDRCAEKAMECRPQPIERSSCIVSHWGRAMGIEPLLYAAAKVGVLTAAAYFIDAYLGKAKQRAIRDWLEVNWYKFEELKMPNLGKAEVASALALMDRVFGMRLFSVHRALATLTLLVVLSLLALLDAARWGGVWDNRGPYFSPVTIPTILAVQFVSIAISISFTRYLSALALHAPDRWMWLAFTMLTIAHVALLYLWGPLVKIAQDQVVTLERALIIVHRTPFVSFAQDWAVVKHYFDVNWTMEITVLERDGFWHWYFQRLGFRCGGLGCLVVAFWFTLRTKAVWFVQGTRLLFSGLFLFAYLLRHVLKPFVLCLWAMIVESDKPVFTFVISGLSTAILLGHEFLKALGKV